MSILFFSYRPIMASGEAEAPFAKVLAKTIQP